MILERLNRDAERIAAHFGLRYTSIQAERANVRNRYGVCYSDGSIRIRLWHVVTRRPLKYSSLVNTLCHELAHLRHFNHGPRFRFFYEQILEYARAQGIYRPGRRGALASGLATAPLAGGITRAAPRAAASAAGEKPQVAASSPEQGNRGRPVQLALF